MSGLFSMIANAFGFSKKEAKILVVGLDNSGKTTLWGLPRVPLESWKSKRVGVG